MSDKALLPETGQKQVAQAFSYKWHRTPSWGVTSAGTRDAMTPWMMATLGHADETAYAAYLARFRCMLDAGCGNGRETVRMAKLNPNAKVIGIDISDSIEVAATHAREIPNARFVRGNICELPFPRESFDHILSFGVLHHTPSTRRAFESVAQLLAPGGEFAFYIYKKKAPLREFADDHVRKAIQSLSFAEAWAEMERMTTLGRALSELNATITVPEIKTLGIEAGRHNLQRLLYYTVFKCYWNDAFSFEENVHVNFDWYAPQYAWRHTEEEVCSWIEEAGLMVTFQRTIPAGMTFRVCRE